MELLLCLRLQYKCTVEYKTPNKPPDQFFQPDCLCSSCPQFVRVQSIGISCVLSFALLESPSGHTHRNASFKSLGSTPAQEAEGLPLFSCSSHWASELQHSGVWTSRLMVTVHLGKQGGL